MEHNWVENVKRGHEGQVQEDLTEDDQIKVLIVRNEDRQRCPSENFFEFVGLPNPPGFVGCEYRGGQLSILSDVPLALTNSIQYVLISDVSDAMSVVFDGSTSKYTHIQERGDLRTQFSSRVRQTTYKYHTASNPPLGMQAISTIYSRHFCVLPLSGIMSVILLVVGISLLQIGPTFYMFVHEFLNICRKLDVQQTALPFFHFMTIQCMVGESDWMGCSPLKL